MINRNKCSLDLTTISRDIDLRVVQTPYWQLDGRVGMNFGPAQIRDIQLGVEYLANHSEHSKSTCVMMDLAAEKVSALSQAVHDKLHGYGYSAVGIAVSGFDRCGIPILTTRSLENGRYRGSIAPVYADLIRVPSIWIHEKLCRGDKVSLYALIEQAIAGGLGYEDYNQANYEIDWSSLVLISSDYPVHQTVLSVKVRLKQDFTEIVKAQKTPSSTSGNFPRLNERIYRPDCLDDLEASVPYFHPGLEQSYVVKDRIKPRLLDAVVREFMTGPHRGQFPTTPDAFAVLRCFMDDETAVSETWRLPINQ
ncbi:MAG: hypothetical protein ACOX0Z_02960 [Candidatus Nanosyncoccaceae bacterium]|jgi:hypothetical protein